MPAIPSAPGLEHTWSLLRDPYRFVSDTCRDLGSELFQARILLQPTICLMGPAAAELFYSSAHLVRAGAGLRRIEKTLVGRGGVQGLDDLAHRHRKHLFLTILAPDRVGELAGMVRSSWIRRAQGWAPGQVVTLYGEVRELLMQAVCRWAGVPLADAEVPGRTREVAALFDHAASLGPRHWWARWARRRSERWLQQVIIAIRHGHLLPALDSASHLIAFHRDHEGRELSPAVAAVELLNVIRPTVAVAVYVIQALHALHLHTRSRLTLEQAGRDDDALRCFVQEVRRWYPFFPATVARVREDFTWRGYPFPRHRRVLLDLYGTNHDARAWEAAESFRPERFHHRDGNDAAFIPQGGGGPQHGHRCPGEPLAIALMSAIVDQVVHDQPYRVLDQDLSLDYRHPPALPRSRFRVTASG